jgi:hypothetical protein
MYSLSNGMRALALCSAAGWVSGCASFEVIHDPRFGAVSKEHLPKLIKSVQCELETFYTANGVLRDELRAERIERAHKGVKTIPLDRVVALNHFDLDDEAYGAFSLDIKVQDSIALPGTSSSFVNILSPTTGHSKSLAIGPSVQAQGTYDNVLWFSVPQNATVAFKPLEITEEQATSVVSRTDPMSPEEERLCYRRTVRDHYRELAEGKYPGLELFDRIQVNGALPLAAWLQENGTTMGVARNILMDAHAPAEKPKKRTPVPVDGPFGATAIDGGQLSYIFTVQYTGSLDVKFSLISSRWNPATSDLSGGVQQTGVLSVYVNGYQAAAAIGAKSALTAINPVPPKPTRVVIVEDDSKNEPLRQGTKDAVQGLVKGALPEESKVAGSAGNRKFQEFISELSKSQFIGDQKNQTLSKLHELNLPQETEKDAAKAVEQLAKPPAPRTRIITIPAEAAPGNDGRGVFRYPPAFPSP